MAEYCVLKTRVAIHKKAYARGDIVELSDKDALPLMNQKIVAAAVETILPSEADGLFDELKKENASLKKAIEKQKKVISGLTEQLKTKDVQISNLTAKK